MKVLIHVTKDILQASVGCQSNPRSCAIARAVIDIFPKASVLPCSILPKGYFHATCKEFERAAKGENVDGFSFSIPSEMTVFITTFDKCTSEEVRNLPEKTFEIDIPDWAIDMIGDGNVEEVKRIIRESKTLELA